MGDTRSIRHYFSPSRTSRMERDLRSDPSDNNFILVIVLTWVYDITPEGIKITKDLVEKEKEMKYITQQVASHQALLIQA